MSDLLGSYLLFFLSLAFAVAMLAEGCLILLLKKQITPLPTQVLYGLGRLVAGREDSRCFLGRTSPKDLRRYASIVLVFGTLILISSGVYLFTAIL